MCDDATESLPNASPITDHRKLPHVTTQRHAALKEELRSELIALLAASNRRINIAEAAAAPILQTSPIFGGDPSYDSRPVPTRAVAAFQREIISDKQLNIRYALITYRCPRQGAYTSTKNNFSKERNKFYVQIQQKSRSLSSCVF